MAAPPTTEQLFGYLQAFQQEYRAAIKAGNVSSLITSKPSQERFGGKHPADPSPELYAINKLMWMGRNSGFTGAMLVDLTRVRASISNALEPTCGSLITTPKHADAMLKLRGVGGYWISWPGVDTSDSAPTVIYFHGGGMFCGDALYLHGFMDRISQVTGCRVLTVEYRLCPDVTPMEAVADGVAAYLHVIEDLKVPHKQVFIAGESGGGQMTLLVTQAIARQGLKSPAGAWPISPVCTADDEDHEKYRVPVFNKNICHFFSDPSLQFGIGRLLRRAGKPDELQGKDARVSPIHGSFADVCPLYFSIGDTEVYVEEGIATYHKAREAGVATRLSVSAHGPHAFAAVNAPEGTAEIAKAFAWLKQYSSL